MDETRRLIDAARDVVEVGSRHHSGWVTISQDAYDNLRAALPALPPAESEGGAEYKSFFPETRQGDIDFLVAMSRASNCSFESCKRFDQIAHRMEAESEGSAPRVVPMRLFADIIAAPSIIRQVLAVVGIKLEPNALDELQDKAGAPEGKHEECGYLPTRAELKPLDTE